MDGNRLHTPVVLFTFNRPDSTEKVLRRVIQANPDKLYFVQDGPRPGHQLDQSLVTSVRRLLELVPNHIEVTTIFAEENLGLRERFLTGLDHVFSLESSAIVIEDDCLVEATFFSFAQYCLERYRNASEVITVSAHQPTPIPGRSSVSFDEVPRIWGWATWSDRWQSFRDSRALDLSDGRVRSELLSRVRSRTWRLMARRLFTPEVAQGSWAVSLSCYALWNGLLSVTPPHNAVTNLGATNGTHFQDWAFVELPRSRPVSVQTRLTSPARRSQTRVWFEDSVRVLKWALASARRPVRAYRKLRSIVS